VPLPLPLAGEVAPGPADAWGRSDPFFGGIV
jgi:hypothetical protein